MFELSVKSEFPAAHQIKGHSGQCARPHGHNWKVEFVVRVSKVDSIGIGRDFRELRESLDRLLDRWDHQDLNTLEEFRDRNPTAENIAELLFRILSSEYNSPTCEVVRVVVWENDRYSATYYEPSR